MKSKQSHQKNSSFDNWAHKKALPFVMKLGNQSHLSAIRDAFTIFIPILIAVSVGMFIQTIIFGGNGANEYSFLGLLNRWIYGSNVMQGEFKNLQFIFNDIFNSLKDVAFNTMALFFVVNYGYFLSKSRKDEAPMMGGLIALGTFFLLSANSSASALINKGTFNGWKSTTSFYGSDGLLAAFIYSTIAIEIYVRIAASKKMVMQLSESVPDAIIRSFAKLFPVILTFLCMLSLYALVALPTFYLKTPVLVSFNQNGEFTTFWEAQTAQGFWTPVDLVYMIFQSPIVVLASEPNINFVIAFVCMFFYGFFWWFGIHGRNVVDGFVDILFFILLAQNVSGSNQGIGNIFVWGSFDVYILVGGCMVTIGIIFATLVFSKSTQEKLLVRFSVPSGVFQFNESIVFGFPLVFNKVYFWPIVFGMPLLTTSTWLLYELFDTHYMTNLSPWMNPLGISALFGTNLDYTSILIVLINVAISILVWAPFILVNNRVNKNRIIQENKSIKEQKVLLEVKKKSTKSLFCFRWHRLFILWIPILLIGTFIITTQAIFNSSALNLTGAIFVGGAIILIGLFGLFKSFERLIRKS